MKKIAIIGAGLTGITIAQKLSSKFSVTIFEKSRGIGGRIATKRANGFEFDHGAQFFTTREPSFKKYIEPMLADDIIKIWDARFAEFDASNIINTRTWGEDFPHYVGNFRMNNICKYLSKDLDIKLNTKIKSIIADNNWRIFDENNTDLGIYDWVILTAPAEQTAELLPKSCKFAQAIQAIKMSACYSLMLGFTDKLNLNFDAAIIKNADISWISANNSKPGRPPQPTLIINSTNEWANQNINAEQDWIVTHLLNEVKKVTGQNLNYASCKILQRWRFANIDHQTNQNGFIDLDKKIAAGGDWCIQGRVESAFLIGKTIAEQILNWC